MEYRIIKGTNQIGGCVTEIKSNKGTRIIIDFGEDLIDDEEVVEFEQEGLTYGKKLYDAVFITHSHGDHIGLAGKIKKNIPIYMDESTFLIYDISCDFIPKYKRIKKDNVNTFKLSNKTKPIIINDDIKVTPYIIDHSSYNSCIFLIEADGKKILHTGDYRNHGRKSKIFENTLKKISTVDILITEGTTLSRNTGKYESEEELEKRAKEIFKNYDQVFILQSSTNIDRIVSFYKAKGNKKFVIDCFTEAITSHLDNIPNFKFDDVYLWYPKKYNKKSDEFKKKYMNHERGYLYGFKDKYVMLIKQSMLPDIKLLEKAGLFNKKKSCFVYSMWEGYIEKDPKMKEFVDTIKSKINGYEFIHTSGHADIETMQKMETMVTPKNTVVIHTTSQEQAHNIFKKYKNIEINVYYEI